MHCNTSRIQSSCDGGEVCFHLRRMARLANKVVKAMMQCTVDDATESGRRPNRTVNGLGAMVMLRVCESVLKMSDQ